MQSIWGVDHGFVSKSYIPGKGWVPATKAGKRALRGAQGAHAKARGVSPKHEAMRRQADAAHDAVTGYGPGKLGAKNTGRTMDLGRGNKAEQWESPIMPGGVEAFAYMRGKRRIMVTKPGADDRFVRHEAAHLSPKKRTSYRLAELQTRPGAAMREEARADMAGGMPYRKAPKTQREAVQRYLAGDQYSGYATAARARGQAGAQRRLNRVQDAANDHASRAAGLNTKEVPSQRRKMFTQHSLSGYRSVQDKIDAGAGVTHKTSAKTHNRINRAKDIGYPVAGGAAVGGGVYLNQRSKRKNR